MFLKIYLFFIWESLKKSEHGEKGKEWGGVEGVGEIESRADFVPGAKPCVELILWPEIMTPAENKSQNPNWLSHPGTPWYSLKVFFKGHINPQENLGRKNGKAFLLTTI